MIAILIYSPLIMAVEQIRLCVPTREHSAGNGRSGKLLCGRANARLQVAVNPVGNRETAVVQDSTRNLRPCVLQMFFGRADVAVAGLSGLRDENGCIGSAGGRQVCL